MSRQADRPMRKRVKHYDLPGHPHELTFSCFRGRRFLRSERTCRYLAEAIGQARDRHLFDVWAYVFMPEHCHLLICPRRDEYSVSAVLQSIKQSVARRALRYVRLWRPQSLRLFATGQKHALFRFWQDGGGYDRNVTDMGTLHAMVEYIHANPVRRGLADLVVDWKWSSARDWLGEGHGPLRIDKHSFPPL
jgi:putative transposase